MATKLGKLSRRMMALNKAGELSDQDYATYQALIRLHVSVENSFDPDGDIKQLDISGITEEMVNLMEPV